MALSGDSGNCVTVPLTSVNVASMAIVPGVLSCEEAVTGVFEVR